MSWVAGEQELHRIFRDSFRPKKGRSHPGDDCARLQLPPGRALMVSSDQLIEGVHVEEGTAPVVMAKKLLRRSLSDLAAAGAAPWAVTWTIAAPSAKGLGWLKRLARAFLREAESFDCPVVGGDVSNAATVVLGCTVYGLESKEGQHGRSGAKVGDALVVTGRLGDSVKSGRHLLPEPRLREGALLMERYRVGAMMDVSDGLAMDLKRMCAASGVGAEVQLDQLPLATGLRHERSGWESAIGEGEDYELLACLPVRRAREACSDRILKRTGLTLIGRVVSGRKISWL
ncbi:MAG: thiamine-phosphate kinase, partial [Planctomycetes bacterium]|nr:thiamine-phosphate kinase [Planctomycetota bacterium]